MLNTIIDAAQQSFIFIPLTLGIYLSYRILVITDLTPDGTFVLGAAIFARMLTSGYNQIESLIAALIGGAIAGIGVCLLQRYARINSLIASILAVFMLYSVNFAVMGRPNITLLDNNTLLGNLQNSTTGFNLFLIIFAVIMSGLTFYLVNSKLGLRLCAYGSNRKLLAKLGKHPTFYLGLGLAISNMLAALCGVFTAQVSGYADIHMGTGMALTGIGAVVIGCQLARTLFTKSEEFNLKIDLIGCFVGTYIYFLILNTFLALGLNPIYLKLILGLVLAIFLATASYSKKNHQLGVSYD